MFLLALEGVFVFGGWKCCGRVELSALCLELLVGSCRIALPGQNHPPASRTPSGAEKVTKHPPEPFRVREKDRLVFKIDGEVLRIVQCGTHYGDL